MSSYFPIPNNKILDSKNSLEIKSSITVFNYPNNALLKNIKRSYQDIYYYIYYLDNYKWKKYERKLCKYGDYLEISRDSLNIPFDSYAVIVPSRDRDAPNLTKSLIEPSTLRVDKCPVAERASYNFTLNKSTTSFQGEFPVKLSKISRSSFFSFDSLRLDNKKNTKTFLVLISLNQDASNNKLHNVNFHNVNIKEKILEVSIRTNSVKYICLPKLNNKNIKSLNPIFITCATSSFIPLYLTVNLNCENYEISLEHTHPPSEFFWGDNRNKLIKLLKSKWIS